MPHTGQLPGPCVDFCSMVFVLSAVTPDKMPQVWCVTLLFCMLCDVMLDQTAARALCLFVQHGVCAVSGHTRQDVTGVRVLLCCFKSYVMLCYVIKPQTAARTCDDFCTMFVLSAVTPDKMSQVWCVTNTLCCYTCYVVLCHRQAYTGPGVDF
jgi:hypothetical protein